MSLNNEDSEINSFMQKPFEMSFFTPLLMASLLFISGCSDPKGYDVTKLTDEQKKELGQKLNADEGQKLTGWMMRHALTDKGATVSTTVAQALKEQDEWVAKAKVEEAKAVELKKQIEAERLAKQEEFAKLVSVALVGKKNHAQEYGRQFVTFEVAYDNKGDKDILGVKGVLRITDIFGDKIMNVRWSYDQGIRAKQHAVERNNGVDINKFIDTHMKLWNTDFDKMKSKFDVSTIIFKDGTKIDAPE